MIKSKIKKIRISTEKEIMYDFTVLDNHNYFVENVLTHNSEHTNLMFVDEIDVVSNPKAYEEAKLIPGYAKGLHPLTVKLSTRKFAFGLMQKEIDLASESGDKILKWNILDVTAQCPPSKHKPELPRENRYVAKSLPLSQISPQEYSELSDVEKPKWELVENVYAGCKSCKLLAVCKTRLAQRPDEEKDGLYKPVGSVINTFKKTSNEMAEAQLMCWKPSTKGLVYPRFENTHENGNVITIQQAWETIHGESKKINITEADLIWSMKNLNIPFYAGVDWGYDHDFVIVIFATLPNGQAWIIDCYSAAGLEFADQLEVAKSYRDKYTPRKWYADTAAPQSIKTFTRNGMSCAKFDKDVMGGIESLRSKIVDGNGRRMLKVLRVPSTEKVLICFQKHHFKLDAQGNPTTTPDNDPGISDQGDAMRYVAQNVFPIKGTSRMSAGIIQAEHSVSQNPIATEQMRQEIYKRVQDVNTDLTVTNKKGNIKFSF